MTFKKGNKLWKKRTRWTGEGSLDKQGYRRVCNNYDRRREHRVVMEKAIGRPLKRTEQVHHCDGDKTNNNLKNLIILSISDHAKLLNAMRQRNKKGQYNKGYEYP